jgi:hypothetical protein
MRITDRWFPLPDRVKKHVVQSTLLHLMTTFAYQYFVIAAGRRSFKTERMLKRFFVWLAITTRNKRYFLGAPTRPQAKQIFWNDVLDLLPDTAIVGNPNRTELSVKLISGSEIHVVGLEAYKRIEGVPWHGAGITEYQEIDPEFFGRTLQPILTDTQGIAVLEGRPIGKNHFYDDFLRAQTDDKWYSSTWPSADVLAPEQIQDARRMLAEMDFRREYEADFESGGQRTYYAFSEANIRRSNIDASQPVIIACDFNATEKPMSWVVGQHIAGITHWHRSLSHTYTHTRTMCEVLDVEFQSWSSYPSHLIFYGDWSGIKNTSNSSDSDWEIIESYFSGRAKYEKRIKPCKSVRNRAAATNALLCNALGDRRMFVDPSCEALMRDWQRVGWKSNGIELDDGGDVSLTHSSDAVDYFSDYEYPITGKPVTRWA